MSFHTFFSFTTGLTNPLKVPVGTKANILAHVEEIEQTLSLKRSKYEDNPVHWDHWDSEYSAGFPSVPNDVLCKTIEDHNNWVRRVYQQFQEWAEKPVTDGEEITPEDAELFWHGLHELDNLNLRPDRWTREYYVARMEHLYEVMRGRESEGVGLDTKALTPKQAAAVIRIFERYLDAHDARLDVPDGHDHIASSYDGGYDWCGTCCRPMIWEDAQQCRRRKCELRSESDQ